MQSIRGNESHVGRRSLLKTILFLPWLQGCATPWFLNSDAKNKELKPLEIPELEPSDLIADVANVWSAGMWPQRIESIALVTKLKGTGSDPPAGPQRQDLLNDMTTHDIKDPNRLLASTSTSLVLTIGYLPPACRKGTRFDVEVMVPKRSETSSLRGGWMLMTRMTPMEKLGGVIRKGHILAIAEGEVLIDAIFKESEDKVLLTKGRVLGGGVSQTERNLGLVVKSGFHTVAVSTMIGAAINGRFSRTQNGLKTSIATPKRDNFVEISLHASYAKNIGRYMDVIRSIALRESPTEKVARIELLEKKIVEPTTAREAALQLEAIGKEGVPALKLGIRSPHREVRFYAAEALAYLDLADGVEVLADCAANFKDFRWEALAALSVLHHMTAYDALLKLLHVPSAEARYGAVRAIHDRQTKDPLVKGEMIGTAGGTGGFLLIAVQTSGEPMIHFAKTNAQEVVVFGADMTMRPPQFLYAGESILIKGVGDNQVKITHFQANQDEPAYELCSNRVVDIIQTIVRLGGNYSDVMQAMQESRRRGYLDARLAIDALPKPNRQYHPEDYEQDETERVAEDTEAELVRTFPKQDDTSPGIFGKMFGWLIPTE